MSFSPEEVSLQPCEDSPPVDLGSISAETATCDIDGLEIVFPNGYSMKAPAMAGVGESWTSSAPERYYAENLGTYGIAAAVRDAHGDVSWSGNSSAIEKRQEIFGKDF